MGAADHVGGPGSAGAHRLAGWARERDAVGGVHTGVGGGGAVCADRTTGDGRHFEHGAGVVEAVAGGVHVGMRFPGLEVGTVGGGTGLAYAQAYLSLLGCRGPGSAYRLAQMVAATAVCLELSASAAAASPGSENYAMAHLQQSGRA